MNDFAKVIMNECLKDANGIPEVAVELFKIRYLKADAAREAVLCPSKLDWGERTH